MASITDSVRAGVAALIDPNNGYNREVQLQWIRDAVEELELVWAREERGVPALNPDFMRVAMEAAGYHDLAYRNGGWEIGITCTRRSEKYFYLKNAQETLVYLGYNAKLCSPSSNSPASILVFE